jgi:type I restriction enzyme, S subunit
MISDWTTRTLGELTEFKSGKTPSKSNPEFWDGHIPWISASSMHGNRYSYSKLRITDAAIKAGSIILDGNTILLLVRGSTLHNRIPVGITTAKVTFNQDVKAIIPKDESVSPWFLLYWLMSKENELLGMVENTGIGAGKLDTKVLKNLEIRIPTKHDQSKLIAFFKSIDDKIHLNHQINRTLESIAQAIFKSWFVDFDPVKAKMEGREPEGMDAKTASLFPDKLVESELGMIPEAWEVSSIADVATVTKGKSYTSAELQVSDTVLVTLKSFQRGGGYRLDGLKEYTGKYKPEQVVYPGDLIVSYTDVTQKAELIGRPAIVYADGSYKTYVISLDVGVVRPLEGGSMSKEYLFSLMNSDHFTQYTYSRSTGTTVLHLSKDAVPEFTFANPGGELVSQLTKLIEPIFGQILLNHKESATLTELRDTLLPKLISGEIQIPTE